MKIFVSLLLIALLLSACVPKPIDIDVKAGPPKLVVASQIIPNKSMIISLTRSFSALEGEDLQNSDSLSNAFLDKILVKDALVTVSYFGITDTLFMIDPGIYASINTLQYTYGTYTIYARDPQTGEEITATTELIPKVNFDTIYPTVIKNPGDTVVKVDFTFHDDPGRNNYYVVNYIRKTNSTSQLDINQAFSQGSNDIIKEFELLDDNSFTNNVYSVSRELEGVGPHDSIAIMLSHISKGYFEYLNAYKRAGALINQLTGEPINYPSNVNNGYGFFNAYYPTTRYYDLNNY